MLLIIYVWSVVQEGEDLVIACLTGAFALGVDELTDGELDTELDKLRTQVTQADNPYINHLLAVAPRLPVA